jgi:hypothetical protein
MPAPESGTFNAGLDAVDVMAKVPDELPTEVGENVVLKLTLWPGLNVTGKLTALVLKPAVAPIAETVTLAPPELVSVSARVWELPTVVLPKERLAALGVSWLAPTPVPDNGKLRVVPLL